MNGSSIYKTLLLLLSVVVPSGMYAQNIIIPDPNFKTFCVFNYDGIDGSAMDSEISQAEAAEVLGAMDCSGLGIADLTGVGHFININELHCDSNVLTSLPDLTSLTGLQKLFCFSNQLTSLPNLTMQTELKRLYCYSNQLTQLPDLSMLSNLHYLFCASNRLTALPDLTSQTNLQTLSCEFNQLTKLPDLSTLTSLRYLDCTGNRLTRLPDITSSYYLSWFYFYCEQNLLDDDDCPEITITEALGLTHFSYSTQGNFSIYHSSLPDWPLMNILDWAYDVTHLTYETILDCSQ